MTVCEKCNHYHWDEITIYRCGNRECGELYPSENGDKKENADSIEFLKSYLKLKDIKDNTMELPPLPKE